MSVDSTTVRDVSKSQTQNGNKMFLRTKASEYEARNSSQAIAARERRLSNIRANQWGVPKRNRHAMATGVVIAWTALVFLAITIVAGFVIAGYTTVNTYDNCVIAGKDRTANSEGVSQMRVYTENCGTFTIGDDWFRGNFTSADLYGSLQDGQAYDFEATGFRIGILSMFPNIISIQQG